MTDETFELTAGDRVSPTWVRLREHFETLRARYRTRNDDVNLGPAQTAELRGRIAVLTALIDLGEEKPEVEPPIID